MGGKIYSPVGKFASGLNKFGELPCNNPETSPDCVLQSPIISCVCFATICQGAEKAFMLL